MQSRKKLKACKDAIDGRNLLIEDASVIASDVADAIRPDISA
jgi:hypothetical protein